MRIVSLLPSATETLGLLAGPDDLSRLLVGRSHECDTPGALSAPVLTAPRITSPHTDPAAIDREVSAGLAAGQSLYTVDEAALRALKPDLILTQDLCAVCSIDLATVRRIADTLSPRPQVVSLNPTTIEGILDDLLTVGSASGLDTQARAAVVRLRERLFHAAEFVNPYDDGPSVALLEWTDPLFCAGHWTVQLIERAGARHPLNPTTPRPTAGAAAGPQMAERIAGPSRRITPEELIASAPEHIIIAPCGLDLAATRRAAEALTASRWWSLLPAAQSRRVALVDGNQMFNRPGPRIVDAFEWLVGWLHGRPDLIPAGFPWAGADGRVR
jgi:iron complex transport system substrate-binding protein